MGEENRERGIEKRKRKKREKEKTRSQTHTTTPPSKSTTTPTTHPKKTTISVTKGEERREYSQMRERVVWCLCQSQKGLWLWLCVKREGSNWVCVGVC